MLGTAGAYVGYNAYQEKKLEKKLKQKKLENKREQARVLITNLHKMVQAKMLVHQRKHQITVDQDGLI
ncbi:MAG: hypothetical protein K5644_05840 [Lachnospiraceae bacterium]|nr:hypothetical protein [Lachnospiraceae bacterium]